MGTRPIRILGIDPGLRRTGWGMVEIEGNRLSFLACGSVASDDKAALSLRLVSIHDGLQKVLAAHGPDEAAVESTFVNRDAAATLKLGQARGIAMLVPALAGLPVAEYAPNLVKKTIVVSFDCFRFLAQEVNQFFVRHFLAPFFVNSFVYFDVPNATLTLSSLVNASFIVTLLYTIATPLPTPLPIHVRTTPIG